MEIALKLIFWVSALLLFHNYILFGWTIRFLAKMSRKRELPPGELPQMTIIIAAHNEELAIGRTLDGILAQDYPADRLKIVVGSDVSSDRTEEIVLVYASRNVTLVPFKERHGKLGILDELIPQAPCGIVVIMDANILLAPEALRVMGERYSDPEVGAVCGQQTVELPGETTQLLEESSYRAKEVSLKEQLSSLGLVVGAFGGFYSIRKECFRPIGLKPMNDDVVIPLEVLGQRRRVVLEPAAIAYEEIGASASEEFRRRIRMTGYNLNTLGRAFRLGARGGLLALYVVFSYKILRWLSAYLFALFAISAASLVGIGIVYKVAAELIGISLLMAFVGYLLTLSERRVPIISSAYYFALMNVAQLFGLVRWMFGVQLFWQRAQR